MPKSVAIVGAGVAGLAAGSYLRMNGYDTEIFESHNQPGGLCTAWKRRGYTFDTCIHWLVGSGPMDPFHALWSELVDMKSIQFVDPEEFMRVEDGRGGELRVFTDVDRLEAEMLEKAPEDADRIRDFCSAVRRFTRFSMPLDKPAELYSPVEGLRLGAQMLPHFPAMRKWIKVTAADYAARCKNPLLKSAFEAMFLPEMAMFFLIMTMVWFNRKSAGYPIGGSLPFAKRLEARYLGLGGRIRYGAPVRRIIAENGSARGVALENGETQTADAVLSAADGHSTLFDMLGGRYLDGKLGDWYAKTALFPSYVQVSLGVARTFPGLPRSVVFPLAEPLRVDPETVADRLGVQIYAFDPTLAPEGGTVLAVLLTTRNHSHWTGLREKDPARYAAEKDGLARAVIAALDVRFGDIASKVEVFDVSTPATVIRFTRNWRGSFEGWLLTPETGFRQLKQTLPGLKDFWMAGQWVSPGGGLPSALLTGRNAAQLMCRAHGVPFRATRA